MLRFWRWSGGHGPGAQPQPQDTVLAFKVEVPRVVGSVNARSHKLWRKDGRYAGHLTVYRDEESGGAVLEFDALRHGAKEPRLREVVAPEHVDKLILSLLEIRGGEWEQDKPTVPVEGDGGLEDGRVEEGAEALIRSMIGRNERLCVCASAGTVVRDQQKPTPYPVDGCLVGVATGADSEGFWLVGSTFATRVKWADLRGAWLRNAAPDPCPHCGTGDSATQQSTTGKGER